MEPKEKALKQYLKEINKLTKHCVVEGNLDLELMYVGCTIAFKEDVFHNGGILNTSRTFEMINATLFMKYFGKPPKYNNTRTIFWVYF